MLYDSAVLSRVFCLGVVLGMATATTTRAQQDLNVENAFPALTFGEQPVDLAADGEGFLYVVDKFGKIFVFENDSTAATKEIFLDLTARVVVDNEAGLLSMAFHPRYAENGYVYVYYIVDNPLRSVIARFTRSSSDPLRIDKNSEVVLLEVEQPTMRHNAGELAFGPDGYLYTAFGDGSTGGDKYGNGQNLKTLLGTIIRIDVDTPEDGRSYGIPPDNPFVGNVNGYREEIFAYGFRNPWRFSIDPETGHIWVGDVGEVTWEEVDFVTEGGNYGWPIMEGPDCYDPPTNCSRDGLFGPVWSTGHDEARSVIGGYVYRGRRVPELRGKYVFADWNSLGKVWALSYDGTNPYESAAAPVVSQVADSTSFISSFGVDENGELYMLYTFWRTVMRFEATGSVSSKEPELPDGDLMNLSIQGPNPFQTSTVLTLTAGQSGRVTIRVFDVLGKEVALLFDGLVTGNSSRDVRLDARELPSGTYFVRATMNDRLVVRKVVLTR